MKKNLYWMAAAFITLTAVGCTNAKKAMYLRQAAIPHK